MGFDTLDSGSSEALLLPLLNPPGRIETYFVLVLDDKYRTGETVK